MLLRFRAANVRSLRGYDRVESAVAELRQAEAQAKRKGLKKHWWNWPQASPGVVPLRPRPAPLIPEAIKKAKGAGVKIAYSHPCFELWRLLHYQNYTSTVGGIRDDVSARLYLYPSRRRATATTHARTPAATAWTDAAMAASRLHRPEVRKRPPVDLLAQLVRSDRGDCLRGLGQSGVIRLVPRDARAREDRDAAGRRRRTDSGHRAPGATDASWGYISGFQDDIVLITFRMPEVDLES